MARVSAAKAPAAARPGNTGGPPPFPPVQLATLVDTVPTGHRWLHEMEYDGYRVLLAVGGEAVAYTRSGLDWSEKFPGLVEAAALLKVGTALIDGEAVVLDSDGRSIFQALQNALKGAPERIDYFAFDLLELDGEDLTQLPITEHKARLAKILRKDKPRLRYSDHIVGNGEKLLHQFCDANLEGVISKQVDGRYVGSRSGGWPPSDKSRLFRSLILGVDEDGVLRYAGKVGTGFDTQEIIDLMAVMAPFEQVAATVKAPRAEVRGAHWLRPKLVAEIAYTEMTNDGTLRHPSYIGLREDKKPEAVVVEREAPVETATAPSSSVTITNRDRVIFPEGKLTTGALADYYVQVAPIMLPWAGSRPISLVRCPQGRAKKCFFQKHDAGSFGDAVRHVAIREKDGHDEPYLYVDTPEGLLTCVQMGTIEFYGWGARIAALPKGQRKGRIFVNYLRNQRGATAVMPYAARARGGAPVAVPITWKEMGTIDKPSHWSIRDGAELVKRAGSKALAGWGRADQALPDL